MAGNNKNFRLIDVDSKTLENPEEFNAFKTRGMCATL